MYVIMRYFAPFAKKASKEALSGGNGWKIVKRAERPNRPKN